MVRHYTLTLTGSAQQLSDVLAAAVRTQQKDDALRAVSLQPDGANANPIYVGGSDAVSDSDYGVRLEAPVGTVPPAPWQPPVDSGGTGTHTLSSLWVIGTADEKLHILVVPFL